MSNDVVAALKGMSLHGMASAWPEVLGTARLKSLDHETLMNQLLKAESGYRDMRSTAYQMRAARFAQYEIHRVSPKRHLCWGPWHWEDTSGNKYWHRGHSSAQQTGSLLLNSRVSQHA